jgi:hypothetical protein
MNDQIVGRDPIAKTMTEAMIAAHPDRSDTQITARREIER